MNQKPNGSEFIASASAALGQKFWYGEWITALYDTCEKSDTLSLFDEIAFNAKSFQKIARLLSAGIPDDNAKRKVASELENSFKRFSMLLEKVLENFQEEQREKFRKEFLTPTADSFERMKMLLDDFAKIKDFYLVRRDKGDKV